MELERRALQSRSRAELDDLFGAAAPGAMPSGEGIGTAMPVPGWWLGRFLSWLIRCLVWQGKRVDAAAATLRNRVSPFGLLAFPASVATAASRVDGKPCWVLDYSRTSWLGRFVRDELREMVPGLYLGVGFVAGRRAGYFSLSYRPERPSLVGRRVAAAAALLAAAFAVYLGVRLNRDEPVTYADPDDHFKYGSTGGERASGIPIVIWKLLPEMFPEYLPGPGLQSLGFLFEPSRDLPIGVSRRNVRGIDSVFVNCAVCHVGSVRATAESPRLIVLGMPANGLDLESFERFLFNCATDERFTAERVIAEMEKRGIEDDLINTLLLRFVGISLMRDRLLMLRIDSFVPRPGTGRRAGARGHLQLAQGAHELSNGDAAGKGMGRQLRSPLGLAPAAARGGHMWLHWDGNNDSVRERNRSAAFGTGATPTTLDRESMRRTEDWLLDAEPPPYPRNSPHYPFDPALAERGRPLYGSSARGVMARAEPTSPAPTSARSRRSRDPDRSRAPGLLHGRGGGEPEPPLRGLPGGRGSGTSARPSAMRTSRSTASGCAGPTSTTARCPH